MQNPSCIRIFFADFGHPMNATTMEQIKTSLKNGLTLMSVYAETCIKKFIGILLFGSECIHLKTPANVRANYESLIAKLDAINANEYNIKLTVQEYKSLLRDKLKRIIDDLVTNSNGSTEENSYQFGDELQGKTIELTILTKKTASLLSHIVADVIKKLQESLEGSFSLNNPKIIQIVNLGDQAAPKNGEIFHYVLCAQDEKSLGCIFKNWLFNVSSEREQLQIILLKDINFVLRCDLDDCIINPAFLRINNKLDLCSDFMFQISTKNSLLGLLRNSFTLEILYRIPIAGISPKLMSGFTQRVYSTRSNNLNCNETLINNQIFEALCKELSLVEQGLLAKCTLRPEDFDLTAYYILTSDGNTLLLNSVASEELYLAADTKPFATNSYSAEEARGTVRSLINQLELLESYCPFKFSSGLYKCLANQLMKPVRRNTFERNLKIETDWKRKKLNKMKELKSTSEGESSMVKNDAEENSSDNFKGNSGTFILKATSQQNRSETKKRKREIKSGKAKKKNKTHPALLFPEEVDKYRTRPTAFSLPELSFSLNENLN